MNAHSDHLFSFAQSPFQIGGCLPWLSRTCSSSDTLQPQGGSSLLPFFLSDFYPQEIKLENCNPFPIYLSAQLLIYLIIFPRILSRSHQGWIRRPWVVPVLYSDPCPISLTLETPQTRMVGSLRSNRGVSGSLLPPPLALAPRPCPSLLPSLSHLLRPGPRPLLATSLRGSRGCGRNLEGLFLNSSAARSSQSVEKDFAPAPQVFPFF